jgi:hypothetical protein
MNSPSIGVKKLGNSCGIALWAVPLIMQAIKSQIWFYSPKN